VLCFCDATKHSVVARSSRRKQVGRNPAARLNALEDSATLAVFKNAHVATAPYLDTQLRSSNVNPSTPTKLYGSTRQNLPALPFLLAVVWTTWRVSLHNCRDSTWATRPLYGTARNSRFWGVDCSVEAPCWPRGSTIPSSISIHLSCSSQD
jgi:hypothetical protein